MDEHRERKLSTIFRSTPQSISCKSTTTEALGMASETTIYLPDTLPFPIKILSLAARASESISTGRRLLNYSFLHSTTTPQGQQSETRIGTWDATFDGELKTWNLKVGDIVNSHTAKSKHALVIVEPCSHGVQVNGLCALCGMDMEE